MENTVNFYCPRDNIFGFGSLKEITRHVSRLGLKKALIVTDSFWATASHTKRLCDLIEQGGAKAIVWGHAQPNPTDKNVADGLEVYRKEKCDFVVSLGGGSAHDCGKAVGIMVTNEGTIHNYEGVDQVKKPLPPLMAINTTAGTAAEMTRFCIITDTSRKVKMAIVDPGVTPLVSINDPELMLSMPKSLTAASGMDALTHAIEAYVSTGANPLTDTQARAAIEIIFAYLPEATNNPTNAQAREKMAYAQYMAGMAFNNASLGYVHAMAHQLGGYYDLPHGVCNAILLPVVQKFNLKKAAGRLAEIADFMKLGKPQDSAETKAHLVIGKIEELARTVGIPAGLKAFNIDPKDFKIMAENAMKDPCGFTNPIQPSLEEIIKMFEEANI